MATATITAIEGAYPELLPLTDIAKLTENDTGGEIVAETIQASAITTKAFAINPLANDPRTWTNTRRMKSAMDICLTYGFEAARNALQACGLGSRDVGAVIANTSSAYHVKGLSEIALRLGVRSDTTLYTLGPMGCYGALPTLDIARTWVERHQRPAVAVCAEVMSPHLQPPPYDKEQAVVHALFGDGAAAVVLTPTGTTAGQKILDVASHIAPLGDNDLVIAPTDRGLHVRIPHDIPEFLATHVDALIDPLLTRNHLTRSDITWWALHPGGRRIIDRVAETLGFDDLSTQAARDEMAEHGNTISVGALMVLRRIRSERPLAHGEYGIAVSFGPGAVLWAALLTGSS
ncbi:3-oxoacyl-[acyl-carrier-protein] synthase III C-terminal domain-containing protein [Streptomyces sp. L2]|uniref:3-oxoacyl-[acyl-carrier-protein] synthase III C-terminal domain-containing protein n=1 Tax=Streptomyces sp. L2 TaxID=2162665 RepID=UPI0013E9313E|nr:3-oxoacyl-[acyl-carrier-protein] synthase III C-terminal domain-containing protein [Streptomyces sp. L2]